MRVVEPGLVFWTAQQVVAESFVNALNFSAFCFLQLFELTLAQQVDAERVVAVDLLGEPGFLFHH